jgi:hypothetical protein
MLVAFALAAPTSALAWGGVYTTADGTAVHVDVSATYPEDPAFAQVWADYLDSLVHAQELARLTLRLAPLAEVQLTCGRGALACYSPMTETIIASPDDTGPDGPTAKQVIAHEYGHHIAANRVNPPWNAEDWGTKRWASYENICARTATGELHPGNEGSQYAYNPGEAFAESYRILTETKAGAASSLWDIVARVFYPDATALALLEQDVTSPWTGNTASTLTGSFGGGTQRTFKLRTPIDGSLVLHLAAPSAAVYREVLSQGSTVLGTGPTIRHEICGERALTLRVVRVRGRGPFSVSFSRP